MKKVIIPVAFLFVVAFSSCKTGTTTGDQENVDVDSLKQVEDVIQHESVDTTTTDTLTVKLDSTVAE